MSGLVADIGSTNARFALANGEPGSSDLARAAVFPCRDFPSLEAVLSHYLRGLPQAERPFIGTLAVAGPVEGDRVSLTNHAWDFSVAELRDRLGFKALFAINDFTAVSLSLPVLRSGDLAEIGSAKRGSDGRLAVIGPGTGLGVGGLIREGEHWLPIPSEGGHMTFAPQTDMEWAIARVLTAKFGHVSNERLLSGPGLINIVQALMGIERQPIRELTAAEITERATAGTDPLCKQALDIFCGALGAAAGDLALLLYADAVFIAGGIAPRIIDFLRRSPFRGAFESKGRFARHLREVATFVITSPSPGLIGAAAHLRQHSRAGSF